MNESRSEDTRGDVGDLRNSSAEAQADSPPEAPAYVDDQDEEAPVVVPMEMLSDDAMAGLIEEYVTRDGTELADAAGMGEKVRRLLQRGDVVIWFDPGSASCQIREAVEPRRRRPNEQG